MSIVTSVPKHLAKLRRSGTRGDRPYLPLLRSLVGCVARVDSIDMTLLKELLASLPRHFHWITRFSRAIPLNHSGYSWL
jgi:hypothetical protein